MAATYLPSNFVTPDPRAEKNPNWTQTECAVPQASILVEDINDRVLIIIAKHPYANSASLENVLNIYGPDSLNTEQTGIFIAQNLAIQQCSGFQLESITVNMPMSGQNSSSGAVLNTTDTLAGDYISDDYSIPRRFVFSDISMQVVLAIQGKTHTFDMRNHLPRGQQIAYYALENVLSYFVNGFTSYMKNTMGDASFFCGIYVNHISPRLFWTSTQYPSGGIRLVLADIEDTQPSFTTLLKNHLFFTDYEQNDTSQSAFGYPTGESIGFMAQPRTAMQNNALGMSIHCAELTQFRKSDSIAPADGSSIIGVLNAQKAEVQNVFIASIKDGTLVSPKITFDRTQTCTQTTIYFRVLLPNGSSSPLQMKATELLTSSIMLTFRLW